MTGGGEANDYGFVVGTRGVGVGRFLSRDVCPWDEHRRHLPRAAERRLCPWRRAEESVGAGWFIVGTRSLVMVTGEIGRRLEGRSPPWPAFPWG